MRKHYIRTVITYVEFHTENFLRHERRKRAISDILGKKE